MTCIRNRFAVSRQDSRQYHGAVPQHPASSPAQVWAKRKDLLVRSSSALIFALILAIFCLVPVRAQQTAASGSTVDPSLYSAMRWRLIGPYRAGRVSAVAGIPGNPAVFYIGLPGGGVWKTTDG